jgi:DNA repair exonuclease SbcCD ATPase subunit
LNLRGNAPIFDGMKRAFILFVIPLLLLRLPVMAQDAGTAAAIAAGQDADERYKRMAADLQAVQSDNEALHAKITAMEQEIQALRDAQAKPADNSSVQEDLKHLAEKIQEVDKKRLEDKDAISEEIRKSIAELEKSLGGVSAPTHSSGPKTSIDPEPPSSGKGYSYTIKDGDTLGEIVRAYNKDFKSKGLKTISLRQAMEANPNVDWARLKVGQKIIIPTPPGG